MKNKKCSGILLLPVPLNMGLYNLYNIILDYIFPDGMLKRLLSSISFQDLSPQRCYFLYHRNLGAQTCTQLLQVPSPGLGESQPGETLWDYSIQNGRCVYGGCKGLSQGSGYSTGGHKPSVLGSNLYPSSQFMSNTKATNKNHFVTFVTNTLEELHEYQLINPHHYIKLVGKCFFPCGRFGGLSGFIIFHNFLVSLYLFLQKFRFCFFPCISLYDFEEVGRRASHLEKTFWCLKLGTWSLI